MLKKKLKKAVSIFQWLLTVVLVSVVLLLIFTTFNPIKSFQVLRVMSGSMEPAIKVGSVAFVQKVKPEALKKGEIITYASAEDPNMSVTHRLVAIEEKEGKTVFITKGDVNNTEDIVEVSSSQIKGRVIFSLPFLGYLSVWVRKPLGFGLLVILPAFLIIISEILNIKKAIEKEVEKKYAKPEKQQKSGSIGSLLIFFLLGISLFQIKPTNAYFSDVIVIEGNTFSMADVWPPPPPPALGQVVINEVMWMGSTVSGSDEWIELRNMTDHDIDISNWRIDHAVAGVGGHLEIPAGYTISANGYFLIANKYETDPNTVLNVSVDLRATNISLNDNYSANGALVLKDRNQNVVDATPPAASADWPKGYLESASGKHQSMERHSIPGDGTQIGSWHTCITDACNSTIYWDVEGNNYGTPKAANLSENDPTSTSSSPSPSPTPELSPTPSPAPTGEPESSPNPSPTSSPEVFPTPTPSPTPETNPTPTPTAEPPTAEPSADEPPKEPQVEEQPQNQTPLPEEGSEISE